VETSDPDDDWEWKKELAHEPLWREQSMAELDGRPIGFIQIIDPEKEETHYWGEVDKNLRAIDIWIGEAEDLGRGYGTQTMHLAIDRCFQNGVISAILIDPLGTNTRAHKFYKRLGFRFVEKRIFGDEVCFVFELKRKK
jgi:aminoglycoside 6'-N-acetyltransferase